MACDWELEDWLLESGEQATRKLMAHGAASLGPAERFLREVWLLDIEVRNGGVAQYFCNFGWAQWRALRAAWQAHDVPSLGPFIAEVERVIAGVSDPYAATLDASPSIEGVYEAHEAQMKLELRRLMSRTA